MRTKTILLSAIAGVLSSASLMAQVYSLNAVGYINVTIPPGFSIIANQLNTTNNFISPMLDSQLLDDNHNGVTIYKYDPVNGFDDTMVVTAGTVAGTANWQGNATTSTLNPGEGVFIFSPLSTNFTLTFVGTVLTGSLTNQLHQNFNLVSSIVPSSAPLDTGLGIVPSAGDTVYFYSSVSGYDETYVYTGTWQVSNPSFPASPTPAVGQGFFYFTPGAAGNTWVNNFSVN